jgi:hypothetical protein
MTYDADLPDGIYELRAVAEDLAKNKAEDNVRLIVGDVTVPVSGADVLQPTFISPTPAQTSLRKDYTVDVAVETPQIGSGDMELLQVVVRSQDTDQEEVLLEISSGKGRYVRPWSSKRPGIFTFHLITQNRNREEKEWEVRTLEVQ